MRLRPYEKQTDFQYIRKWVSDERTHALWSANTIAYPLEEGEFHDFLTKGGAEWGDCGYIFMDDKGNPVGFCIFNIHSSENFGFTKFVVLDASMRGKGYGTQMMKLLLEYAFETAGVDEVRINVFDCNISARKCYERVGFQERAYMENAFAFEGESWGRYQLAARRLR